MKNDFSFEGHGRYRRSGQMGPERRGGFGPFCDRGEEEEEARRLPHPDASVSSSSEKRAAELLGSEFSLFRHSVNIVALVLFPFRKPFLFCRGVFFFFLK